MEIEKIKIKKLEDRLFANGEMTKPPCFCCGYNGHGYYQPDIHPCAERHHKLFDLSQKLQNTGDYNGKV